MQLKNYLSLKQHERHWKTLRDAQYIKHLNQHEKEGLERIMREEFSPNYRADLWCPTCVGEMVREVYTRFEVWAAQNEKEARKHEAVWLKAERLV
jgi:hypothetical protein